MTHSDSITLLLDLKASDLVFPEENFVRLGFTKLTGQHQAQIFSASYRPKKTVCPACGVIAQCRKVRDYRTSQVLMTPAGHRPRVLALTKAKYDCADCGATFTPNPYFIAPRANISSVVKAAILLDFKVKMSMRDVARRYFVSPAFCWQIVDQISLKQAFRQLPEVLCFDEFKATQNSDNGLAFVYSDGLTHDIIDILESRKQADLMAYFLKFPRSERLKVKTIVMDMNASYPALLTLFPNAQLIIDGFHVVQQLSRVFNQLRVKEMKELKKLKGDNGKVYRKLKKYWRQLLKWNGKVNYQKRKQWTLFRGEWRTEGDVIDYLLSYSQKLQEAYTVYQNVLDAFQNKQADDFFEAIETLPESLPEDFKKSCRYLLKHKQAIARGIVSPYSNGPLEGKNNLCKLIKRIAFGFVRFDHLRKRILLQQILVKKH
ncbi:ISL3 family transposase [Lactococcus muris]|uniref:ISL3 family transposase n=1 Tax=Lactococcus muris TaxID=2941330 RepID=UPI0023002BB3